MRADEARFLIASPGGIFLSKRNSRFFRSSLTVRKDPGNEVAWNIITSKLVIVNIDARKLAKLMICRFLSCRVSKIARYLLPSTVIKRIALKLKSR